MLDCGALLRFEGDPEDPVCPWAQQKLEHVEEMSIEAMHAV
jgi:hypothetical protein